MADIPEKYNQTKKLKQIFLLLFFAGLSIFPVLKAQDVNLNNQNKGFPADETPDRNLFSVIKSKKLNVGITTWNANWIWQEADGPANTWACFRKTFLLDEIPVTAKAKIAVDSKYWLWINGQEVILEGGLKRGPTPDDTYYELVDIKKFLRTGKNVIAVQVWYFGKDGFSHHDSSKGGFLFECNLGNVIIKSDATWKMIIHPSYERSTVNSQPNVRLSESLIRYNAVNDTIGDWKEPEYDDSFLSDDVFYNKLWQKAQRTLYLAMRDNYMDCPDRERALWWGDAVIHIGKSFYALDRKSDLLSRKSISNLIEWQREDRSLYAPVPSGNWENELPAQMLATVGEFGFWNYFMYTGDTTTIAEVYPNIKNYLDLWMFKSNGLLTYRPGGWDWSDWGEDIDSEIIQNTWYYLALKAAKEMAVLSGNPMDTLVYHNRMQYMKNSFNDVFWNGLGYRSPTYTGLTDDRANAMAVLAGFADKTKWSKIRNLLLTRRGASPYMEKYVLEALFVMGYEKDAMARMKHPDRYLRMVEDPGTTLSEYFDSGGSNNHAWSGGPLILMSKYCSGVAPLTPGFDTYRVFPQEGNLNYVRSVTPSVKGNIEVEIIKDSLKYQLKLISPDKTKAVIGIPVNPYPDKKIKSIYLNNTVIWSDNFFIEQDYKTSYSEVEGKYIVFEVNPGTYEINAELETDVVSGIVIEEYPDFQCRLSPNPVVDNLHIQFDQINSNVTEINIFNLRGKLLKYHKTYNHEVMLKVNDLLPGLYFVKVNNGQYTRVAYFMKNQ